MIEIVLPTMWKSDKIFEMIHRYIGNPNIYRIHLIDNTNEFNIHYPTGINSNKVKIYSFKENTYVNPAWNFGVSKCKEDSIVCITNDDILFDTDIFDFIINNQNQFGIIGMDKNNYDINIINRKEINNMEHHEFGWGCLIFILKKDWINIPNALKVFYGDNFMFQNVKVLCKKLSGFFIDTNMSTTSSSPFVMDVHKTDIENWELIGNKSSYNHN
jgi:hypothetical protein